MNPREIINIKDLPCELENAIRFFEDKIGLKSAGLFRYLMMMDGWLICHADDASVKHWRRTAFGHDFADPDPDAPMAHRFREMADIIRLRRKHLQESQFVQKVPTVSNLIREGTALRRLLDPKYETLETLMREYAEDTVEADKEVEELLPSRKEKQIRDAYIFNLVRWVETLTGDPCWAPVARFLNACARFFHMNTLFFTDELLRKAVNRARERYGMEGDESRRDRTTLLLIAALTEMPPIDPSGIESRPVDSDSIFAEFLQNKPSTA